MNKWFLRIASVLVVFGLLVGCGAEEQDQEQVQVETNNQNEESTSGENTEEQNEDTVRITISKGNGDEYLNEKEIEIEEGAILMEVMKNNFELKEDGGFITSIEGVAAKESEKTFWAIMVNGEMAQVGAKELKLSPGDEVTLDLQSYE
ncbi:DUF4430 domain-containing protein [Virgibacillus doumboii]|uniref:DUF4430 domain-containing protein n=1 Tax=Virgibacillus doumboii TaxID=2697503 RepID=UPI0013DFE773|nr:DUF4430 domain-containing protein [Virgibacillus doumboii]